MQILGQNDGPAHAFGFEFLGELRNGQGADGILASGHRDVAVVENFVSDVEAAGDQRVDGELAGMEKRPVADVLEHVIVADEGSHADPGGAFAAHLREVRKRAAGIGEAHRHGVAADASAADLAFEQKGRTVVGTAGAEIRGADGERLLARLGDDVFEELNAGGDLFSRVALR